jgi:TonB family protein
MTILSAISTQPLVHALGWTLLHLCWQGLLVAGVLWCVLGVMHGRSSRVRYAAACLALGLMVALPVGTFAHLASAEYQARAATGGAAIVMGPAMVVQVGAGTISAPWSERVATALDQALPWVLLAWFAGLVVFVARLHVGLMVARRLRSMATSAVTAELQQAFDEIKRRLGVERAVRLMHSALVQVPTVIGWLRPVVLIPASCLSGLSPMQIEAILAHELAHIRRHDYLVSVLQSVIETLLFYHPAVWWVSRQVRRERECCCDEMAVAVGGDRLAYARALSVLEERRAAMPEFVLGANGGVLTMRIRRLLGCKEDAAVSQFAAIAVLALMVIAAGSYVVAIARAEVNAVNRVASLASRTPIELEPVAPMNLQIAPLPLRPFQMKEPVMMAQAEAPVAPSAPVEPVPVLPPAPPPPIEPIVRLPMAAPGGPVQISAGVSQGMVMRKVAPVYPARAKAAHVQGAVILHAIISKNGTIKNLAVISGHRMLVNAAREAVSRWTYKPYLLNGEPIDVETSITVNFNLADSTAQVEPKGVASKPNDPPMLLAIAHASDNPADYNGGPVRQVGGGVKGPLIIYQPEPEYTQAGKKAKVQGVATVAMVVDANGIPQNVHLAHGLGVGPDGKPDPKFKKAWRKAADGMNQSAVDAVTKYRFKPASENGKPVAVYLNVEVNFEIF